MQPMHLCIVAGQSVFNLCGTYAGDLCRTITNDVNTLQRVTEDVVGSITGVGKDAAIVTSELGAKQSHVPYRFDLVPPNALFKMAETLSQGAEKYGIDNWRGIPTNDHLNHVLTHIYAYLAGDESDEHLAHALTRMAMAIEVQDGN